MRKTNWIKRHAQITIEREGDASNGYMTQLIEVEAWVYPEEPAQYYESRGSLPHPGAPASVDIISAWCRRNGEAVELTEEEQQDAEEQLIEAAYEYDD
jgi:hypothetical protein